jgi:hypothetical protein
MAYSRKHFMPPRGEPILLGGVDIIVLFGHLVLLAAQIIVATCVSNHAAMVAHIVIAGVHAMVRDTVNVIHWITNRHHGVDVRTNMKAVLHLLLAGVSLDAKVASGMQEIVEGQTVRDDVQP